MIPMDWIFGLIGGLMIGTAAATYLLVGGQIMGASGILGRLLDGSARSRWVEHSAFILGLIALPALMVGFGSTPNITITSNVVLLVLGGLLVGAGTRMANGCTSGHGVCGISRLSVRGIVATLAYLGFGFLTMALLRHGLGVL